MKIILDLTPSELMELFAKISNSCSEKNEDATKSKKPVGWKDIVPNKTATAVKLDEEGNDGFANIKCPKCGIPGAKCRDTSSCVNYQNMKKANREKKRNEEKDRK